MPPRPLIPTILAARADMLEVGRLKTPAEDQSHFSAWAIASSPLILGFDMTDDTVMDRVWKIISNKEVIAVNQAFVGGSAGRRVHQSADLSSQVWSKPLALQAGGGCGDGCSFAVLLLSNSTATLDSVEVDLADISPALVTAAKGSRLHVRDLHAKADVVPASSVLSADGTKLAARALGAHDSRLFKLTVVAAEALLGPGVASAGGAS